MWFKESKYAWFIVSFLWVFGFIGSIGRFVVQYYQDPITSDLGTNRALLGYAWSASIMIGSLCAPFGGWLTDRWGYKVTMVLGSVTGVISTAVILLFSHPAGYFVGFGILGGLAGIGASTSYVFVTQWFQHHRAKALMILSSAGSLGLAVITPIFVMNDSWLTWRVAYKFSIGIGLVFVLLIMLIVRERKGLNQEGEALDHGGQQKLEEHHPFEQDSVANKARIRTVFSSIKSYVQNPVLMVVIFALFTCGFSMGTVEMHLMAIQQTMHVSHNMFIASLSILGVMELAGGFVFAALLDRMPRAVALGSLYLIRAIAFLVLFVQLQLSPVLFTLIFGATYLGAIPGGILLANESLKSKSVGLQTGMLLLFHQLGAGVAAITGGMNYDFFHNYQGVIGINIAMSLICCVGYFIVRERKVSEREITSASL